jgi:hypothetical protein
MTKIGIPNVENVSAKEEVWTTEGWVAVDVTLVGEASIYRVDLSDGSHLHCVANTLWPVMGEGKSWDTIMTANLKPGIRIVTYPPLSVSETPKACESALMKARDTGLLLGQNLKKSSIIKGGIAEGGFAPFNPKGSASFNPKGSAFIDETMCPEEIREFVEGLADAQDGHLIGSPSAMANVQLLLRRAGANNTLLEKGASMAAGLYVDNRTDWKKSYKYQQRLKTSSQEIVNVVNTNQKRKVYEITTNLPKKMAIAAQNTMVAIT